MDDDKQGREGKAAADARVLAESTAAAEAERAAAEVAAIEAKRVLEFTLRGQNQLRSAKDAVVAAVGSIGALSPCLEGLTNDHVLLEALRFGDRHLTAGFGFTGPSEVSRFLAAADVLISQLDRVKDEAQVLTVNERGRLRHAHENLAGLIRRAEATADRHTKEQADAAARN